jgi:hypothetical protein
LSIGEETRGAVQEWVDDPDTLDEERLIGLIERKALEHIRDAVA